MDALPGNGRGWSQTQLNEGRDLLATTDMRALFKGILREHLEVGSDALARSVFPDSAGLPSLPGLVRAG